MAEVSRVLRPGGTLLYSDFHPEAARAGFTRSFKDQDAHTCTVPHRTYDLALQLEAAGAANLAVDVVRELRVGVDLTEAFPKSEEFYRKWDGLPIVLVVRGAQVMRLRCSVPAAITFINAAPGVGEPGSLRIAGARIAALGEAPAPGDAVVDLQGDRLLPGLINAHDHLQLNSLRYPQTGTRYRHVREWMADINARRQTDPEFESSIAAARDERLLIGGLKNLLSGVTTVAHHDPLYPFLSNALFPTGVVGRFGWSHSLYVGRRGRPCSRPAAPRPRSGRG